jgi:hypothetical protein
MSYKVQCSSYKKVQSTVIFVVAKQVKNIKGAAHRNNHKVTVLCTFGFF